MSPVSLTYWNIPGYVIFWVIFIVAIALFLFRAFKLWRYLTSIGFVSLGPNKREQAG